MSNLEYIYRSMTPNDEDQVRQLCYHYWRVETISRALGLEVPRECEKYVEYMLAEGLTNKISVVAEEQATGNIVGINIFVIATPDNPQDWAFPKDDPDCTKINKIEEISDRLKITRDYFTFYNVNKIAYSIGLTVLASHQHKCVAFELSRKSAGIARLLGVQLFLVDCVTGYARQIMTKLGSQELKRTLLVDPETGIPLRLPGDGRNLYVSLHGLWVPNLPRL